MNHLRDSKFLCPFQPCCENSSIVTVIRVFVEWWVQFVLLLLLFFVVCSSATSRDWFVVFQWARIFRFFLWFFVYGGGGKFRASEILSAVTSSGFVNEVSCSLRNRLQFRALCPFFRHHWQVRSARSFSSGCNGEIAKTYESNIVSFPFLVIHFIQTMMFVPSSWSFAIPTIELNFLVSVFFFHFLSLSSRPSFGQLSTFDLCL